MTYQDDEDRQRHDERAQWEWHQAIAHANGAKCREIDCPVCIEPENTMTMMELRKQARAYWPNWSRNQRARWVRAELIAPDPKVGTAPDVMTDERNYRFARSVR